MLVGCFIEAADHRALMVAEMGIPYVDDEDGAIPVAAIPRLMFDCIVERESFPHSPLAGFSRSSCVARPDWGIERGMRLDGRRRA